MDMMKKPQWKQSSDTWKGFNPMRLSQQITIIRGNCPLPMNAGMKFPRMREEKTTGIFAFVLGVMAFVPVLFSIFI
jgi:hypothetical protein